MTATTNHFLTILNRFGVPITAPAVYVKPLAEGQAEVHIESSFHIELGQPHLATYATSGRKTKGTFQANSAEFTERQTYLYKGEFSRTSIL